MQHVGPFHIRVPTQVSSIGRWALYHREAPLYHYFDLPLWLFFITYGSKLGPMVAQTVKHLSINVGDLGLIPGSGRFPGEGNGNPFQYSCLENPMDGGAWCRLLSMGSDTTERFHFRFTSANYVWSDCCNQSQNFLNYYFKSLVRPSQLRVEGSGSYFSCCRCMTSILSGSSNHIYK